MNSQSPCLFGRHDTGATGNIHLRRHEKTALAQMAQEEREHPAALRVKTNTIRDMVQGFGRLVPLLQAVGDCDSATKLAADVGLLTGRAIAWMVPYLDPVDKNSGHEDLSAPPTNLRALSAQLVRTGQALWDRAELVTRTGQDMEKLRREIAELRRLLVAHTPAA